MEIENWIHTRVAVTVEWRPGTHTSTGFMRGWIPGTHDNNSHGRPKTRYTREGEILVKENWIHTQARVTAERILNKHDNGTH